MPLVNEPVHCPQIESDQWFGTPVRIGAGDVVLVDFWDYTCVNCLNTLPYLQQWQARYADKGLTIVGVHAPEFPFARQAEHIERAIRDLGITWPVALDNDYRNWQAYANRYWPAKYLADMRGYLRYYQFGEGGYAETEEAIQALLRVRDPAVDLPEILTPLRDRDTPGAVCFRPTPELYLGYARGLFGHQEAIREDVPQAYATPARRAMNAAYLDGLWTVQRDRSEAAGPNAALSVWYQAAEVNLVMAGAGEVAITLDDGPVPAALRGADVQEGDGGQTVIRLDGPRMYRLVRGDTFGEHELRLRARSAGPQMYAFTFVTCVRPSV